MLSKQNKNNTEKGSWENKEIFQREPKKSA